MALVMFSSFINSLADRMASTLIKFTDDIHLLESASTLQIQNNFEKMEKLSEKEMQFYKDICKAEIISCMK